MKRITLDNIKRSLETMTHQVEIDPDVAAPRPLGRGADARSRRRGE
jgi:quinolinate synthase